MSTLYVGIDVSAKTLHVATSSPRLQPRTFKNDAGGHSELCRWLRKRNCTCRVVLEPTGIYSLDVALALHDVEKVELAMPNPRAVRRFAEATLARGKDDRSDALVLVAFGQSMPFTPWQRPSDEALQARAISRMVIALGRDKAALRQRLHAARQTATTPSVVQEELQGAIKEIEKRQARLRKAAKDIIMRSPELRARFEVLVTMPGIADGHAITLLTELSVLPSDMSPKQWTAHAGLDPTSRQSGTTLKTRPRISRRGNARVRQSLYLASLTAVNCSDDVRRIHARLVERGKTKNQAHCAIMRKYLHVVHAMWTKGCIWDGSRFGS